MTTLHCYPWLFSNRKSDFWIRISETTELQIIFFLTRGRCEPLRPVTTLLHSSLPAVSCTTSGNGRPHQSMISYTHLLDGLPLIIIIIQFIKCLRPWLLCRSPSTMPSMIAFISLLSGIRHIWPNNCSFLCCMMSTTVKFLCTLSLMLLLVILSFQHTLVSFGYSASQMLEVSEYLLLS